MDDLVNWVGGQAGALVVAGLWAVVAAVKRKLGRRKKVLGILAAHLPEVVGKPFERAANDLTQKLSTSLMGQEEDPPNLEERDLVRELLKPQRAQTELPDEKRTPPPLPPPRVP